MIHLKKISKVSWPSEKNKTFPFNTKVVSSFSELSLTQPVTFFVGENGSGKSTLLEGIAASCNLPSIGSKNTAQDETLQFAQELAQYLKLSWSVKSNRGFFLRAEDFFGFTKHLNELRAELESEIIRQQTELPDGYGKDLALGALNGQLESLTQRYGVDLNAASHGESFLQLFQSRIKPNGLYLLDEPETPLSPTRQMSLLRLIYDAVAKNCQFIIITHSPILMAYPNAEILDFNIMPPQSIEYEQVEHVRMFKSFLQNKDRYLKELFDLVYYVYAHSKIHSADRYFADYLRKFSAQSFHQDVDQSAGAEHSGK
jgi:predicted ATPase